MPIIATWIPSPHVLQQAVVQNEKENDQDDDEVIQNNHEAVQDEKEDSSHYDSLSNSGTEEVYCVTFIYIVVYKIKECFVFLFLYFLFQTFQI